jgi:hypothetical protein
LERCHCRANLINHPGEVSAWHIREGGREKGPKQSGADFPIGWIDPCGPDLHEDFPCSWLRLWYLLKSELICCAILMDLNRVDQ